MHELTFAKGALLFVAALIAGAVNSVAGGGTLLTFPALLSVGLLPITANATSTVALVPGSLSAFWGYRSEMKGSQNSLLWIGLPSLFGGAVGAFLAVKAGDSLFSHLVPWLILGATVLFMIQDPVRRWLDRRQTSPTPEEGAGGTRLAGVMAFQFLVAVYGGFFGAGIGILMLAALGFLGLRNIHRMNGLKNFAAVCINGVGAMTFIAFGRVQWPIALLMMVAAVIGGYGGAGIARRLGQQNVRRLVIAIGLGIGFYLLLHRRVS